MEIKEGDKFLYKFGWFGTSFGGPTAWLFGKKYQSVLTVEKHDEELMFMDGGLFFGPVFPLDEKFMKKLTRLNN